MSELFKNLKGVNAKSRVIRDRSTALVLNYLSTIDKYLDSKETRAIWRFINNSNSPNVRQIRDFMRVDVDPDLDELVLGLKIDRKEPLEATCFYEQVSSVFDQSGVDYKTVIDFCSGNCLNGAIWMLKGAEKVYFGDIHESKNSKKVRKKLEERFGSRFSVDDVNILHEDRMDSYLGVIKKSGGVVATAIHACIGLTDRIIFSSVKHGIPFAVAPCCYSRDLKDHFGDFIDYPPEFHELAPYFEDFESFVNMVRINYALQHDYSVKMRVLPKSVTDKNKIIIGVPN